MKSLKTFLLLGILILSLGTKVSASENIKVTRIAEQENALYVYWERVSNIKGYNVNFFDSKNNLIETDIVDKNHNFTILEDYKTKNPKKFEIVGVKQDNSTISIGYNLQYSKGFPLDVNEVILGCYEDNKNIYPIFNPDFSIKKSNIIIGNTTLDVIDGAVRWKGNGNYTILAKVELMSGQILYGTYSGESVNLTKLDPKKTDCIIIGRSLTETSLIYNISGIDNLQSNPNITTYDINGNVIEKGSLTYKNNNEWEWILKGNEVGALISNIKSEEDYYDLFLKGSKTVPFSITEEHIKTHLTENKLEGEISHPSTDETNTPYQKIRLTLGSETIMDMMVNGKLVYKEMTDGDLKDLYIPLQKGSNDISIVVYTRDGKTQTKSFIISYTPLADIMTEAILSKETGIIFTENPNGQTIDRPSFIFEGSITGGTNLLVNDIPIDLDVDYNFKFKANLESGENKFIFTVVGPNESSYSENISIHYTVPDIITDIDSLESIDKKYKYIPEEVITPTPSINPSYEELLLDNKDEEKEGIYILVIGVSIIFVGLNIIILTIIHNKKKKEGSE